MSIDLATTMAIDTHVPVEADDHGPRSPDDEPIDASARYVKARTSRTPTTGQIAEHCRERRPAVVLNVDAHTATGHLAPSGGDVLACAAEHADVLIPFASVGPHEGAVALLAFGEASDG